MSIRKMSIRKMTYKHRHRRAVTRSRFPPLDGAVVAGRCGLVLLLCYAVLLVFTLAVEAIR